MAAFTAQLPNVMSQLGTSIMNSAATGGTAGLNAQSRATLTLGNKQRVVQKKEAGKQLHFGQRPERWLDTPGRPVPEFENLVGLQSHVQWNGHPRQSNFQVRLLLHCILGTTFSQANRFVRELSTSFFVTAGCNAYSYLFICS